MRSKEIGGKGWTLIEMMLVVTLIALLVLIAYPSYQGYVKQSTRTAMMTELQRLASHIHTQQLLHYKPKTTLAVQDESSAYTVSGMDLASRHWVLIATPIAGRHMEGDGLLSLNAAGQRCHGTRCGYVNEWYQ